MTATLYSLLLLVLFSLSAFGVGSLALSRVRGWANDAERIVFAITLGMGLIAYAVLALGLLGILNRWALWALLCACVVDTRGLIVLKRAAKTKSESSSQKRSPAVVVSATLVALGLLTLIGALAPPSGNEWDALSYQLADPKIYLRHGRIFYLPWESHSNFPFTLPMAYTLMLGLGSVGAAKGCHWLCGVLLVVSVYLFALRCYPTPRGKNIGLVGALVLASTPIVLWEASVAYVDLATALFTWLSLYALFVVFAALTPVPALTPGPSPNIGRGEEDAKVASREAEVGSSKSSPLLVLGEGPGVRAGTGVRASWLLTSAALMGFALGTKLTVLGFWGIGLVGLVGLQAAAAKQLTKESIKLASLWGGVSLLVAAPWFVKAWAYTGNPVYPFFYGLFGGRYWNAANAAAYAADQARFGAGKGLVDLLLSPWQVTQGFGIAVQNARPFVFTEYTDFGVSPVYVAFLMAAPWMTRRLSRVSLFLAWFGLGVFVFWFFLMQQTRYLIPALPAFALVVAEMLVVAWDERPLARWFGAGLVALAGVHGLYLAATKIALPALPIVTGQVSVEQYVADRGFGMRGLMAAVTFINQQTPPQAKVALFDEVRGFYLDREYLWATPNHSTLLPWEGYQSVDDWLADFKRRGFTTLLVNTRNAPPQDDGQIWRRLLPQAVAQKRIARMFEARGVEVYQIL